MDEVSPRISDIYRSTQEILEGLGSSGAPDDAHKLCLRIDPTQSIVGAYLGEASAIDPLQKKTLKKIVETLNNIKRHCCGVGAAASADCRGVLNKVQAEKEEARRAKSARRRK